MQKTKLLLLLILLGKFSIATGYSGLNDELIWVYALLIGFVVLVNFLKKGLNWITAWVNKPGKIPENE